MIHSEAFCAAHRANPTDFTRRRTLPFPTMILFLLNLLQGSLAKELQRFFLAVENRGLRPAPVTPAAVCQARKKLLPSAFQALHEVVVAYFYRHMPWRNWKGFRVVAVDGSTAALPKTQEIQAHYGTWGNPPHGGPGVIARLSVLYDVLNQIPIHGTITPTSFGERQLLKAHADHLRTGDLCLLDRGYGGFWVFRYLLHRGVHFLCRLPTQQRGWKVVRAFLASGAQDAVVTLRCPPSAEAQCQALGLSTEPLTVRLIRLDLPNGEVVVLATSLVDASR
ncbi:IS4 family transposase, partial [Deferrisoma palaeochoriense]